MHFGGFTEASRLARTSGSKVTVVVAVAIVSVNTVVVKISVLVAASAVSSV
jgi:hypothetical protein